MYLDTPEEVGLLVGAIVGTLPALAVMGFALWWCSVIVERRSGTNRTPRTEAQLIRVRPKIHEASANENAAHYDDSHVLLWKKTQVSHSLYW
jgi:hypothetical protein